MISTYILFALVILLLVFIIYKLSNSTAKNENPENLSREIIRIETSVKEEISRNRTELGQSAKDSREELSKTLKDFSEANETRLTRLTEIIDLKLKEVQDDSKSGRKEMKEVLGEVKKELKENLEGFSDRQRLSFGDLIERLGAQNIENKAKLDQMSGIIEKSIKSLQDDNAAKLEKMRETVDEKLQKTLETRLGESFKLVSERLEAVHKGLGDMQQLAVGVGDLKKIMSNVKTRGVMGEYQLENILEQLLTPDQYGKNVKTKEGSNALVEFAVKLPGNNEKITWLPLDSKFPKEDFEKLMDAYELANLELIDEHRKNFVKGIKKSAADIRDRYIDPPNTTDFAILFLPFESLYAEVLRTPGLFDSLQKEYKINITGPSTLSAFLNSLQMGFRTLAIQRRSSEVWDLLSSVKTEFGKFGEVLAKTKKKLSEASDAIDNAEIRTRVITKKLRDVHELPADKAVVLLGEAEVISLGEEDDKPDE